MSSRLTAIDAEALRTRTRSRADFVYESLRDAIWDGRIAVGERVREEEIARNLGVSRTPVREALQRLQQRGLLVFGAGRGLTVASLSQHQVLQLYAMREILEGSAARFAAEHATAPEIALLWRLQKELCKPDHDATALVTLNRRLHQAIYEAAHNQYLLQTLGVLHDSLALLHSTTFRVPSRRLESDEEHRRIVEAIERHNPDRAEEAARQHIRQAQRTRFENAALAM
ncbi:MAG TPA: GntR family transcriptional regulator [Steroidobacteraceae bacterium]|jgi:DNA-binding GntR family transcriptional regulator|nr:GntR family transcriptional regulator [Steroidobacteraceae bacterium]